MVFNSFVTTVATPRKCTGRDAPSSTCASPSTVTYVWYPSGYTASNAGR